MSDPNALSGAAIVTEAQQWIGVPYLYGGGRSSAASARLAGVDCSGFVYQVFTALGVDPGTDTVSQLANPAAAVVPDIGHAQAGDLVFFGSPLGGPQEHVGIYLGNDLMIDAPHTGSTVRIDHVTGWGEPMLGIRRLGVGAGATLTGQYQPNQPDPASPFPPPPHSSSGDPAGWTRFAIELVGAATALALIVGGVWLAAHPPRKETP